MHLIVQSSGRSNNDYNFEKGINIKDISRYPQQI